VDKTIPHRELRNNSSAVLREVQSGTTFRITNHGEVVAILTSPDTPPAASPALGLKVWPARVRGGFSDLERTQLDISTQEIMDELRGDR
jgi:prevent-host-death family protein